MENNWESFRTLLKSIIVNFKSVIGSGLPEILSLDSIFPTDTDDKLDFETFSFLFWRHSLVHNDKGLEALLSTATRTNAKGIANNYHKFSNTKVILRIFSFNYNQNTQQPISSRHTKI